MINPDVDGHKGKCINELMTTDNFDQLGEEDLELLLYSEEENYRRGNFERIFPLVSNIDVYSQFFEATRYNNLLLWRWLKSNSNYLKLKYGQQSTTVV